MAKKLGEEETLAENYINAVEVLTGANIEWVTIDNQKVVFALKDGRKIALNIDHSGLGGIGFKIGAHFKFKEE